VSQTNGGPVDAEEFDQAWKVFCEIGQLERHFNELESRYRALASTWLLATFAGAGFVLSQQLLNLPFDRLVLVAVLALAGATGITLLCTLDLMVYHQLLEAAYLEGLKMENTYQWLPRVRSNMMQAMKKRGLLARIVLFYVFGDAILLLTGGTALTAWMWKRSLWLGLAGASGTLVVTILLCVGLYLWTVNDFKQLRAAIGVAAAHK
jgi:hypothetical protein